MKIEYCNNCLMPDTKPNLTFDKEGICSACRNHEKKKEIDWDKRFSLLQELARNIRMSRNSNSTYDMVVPVSGGKDSIAQVHYAVKVLDLKVLAVNVDYGIKTKMGIYNLSRVPEVGCDLITFKPDQVLHRKLVKQAFIETGTPDSINHPLLYCYPIHFAEKLNIPFVMFGENPEFEYTGSKDFKLYQSIDERWYEKNIAYDNDFMDSMRANYDRQIEYYYLPKHFVDSMRADYDKLIEYYFLPKKMNAKTIFLGDYIYWDSHSNLEIAKKYAFQDLMTRRKGTYRNFSGIDEEWNFIHQYGKYLRCGFGRCTDHCCEDIRNNRLSREEAKVLVKKYDSEPLQQHIIYDFCKYIGITEPDFWEVMRKNTNAEILLEKNRIQAEW